MWRGEGRDDTRGGGQSCQQQASTPRAQLAPAAARIVKQAVEPAGHQPSLLSASGMHRRTPGAAPVCPPRVQPATALAQS